MFLYWKIEKLIQFLLTFLLFYNLLSCFFTRSKEIVEEIVWDSMPFPPKRQAGVLTHLSFLLIKGGKRVDALRVGPVI